LQRLRLGARDKEPELCFPVRKKARIALLEAHFRRASGIREFTLAEMQAMQAWQPEALVAPLEIALMLADQKGRGLFHVPSLNTVIVVLTSTEDSPLADHHRDLLWHAFGLPVFEQLRDAHGRVIARECEVHDGLHLAVEEALDFEGDLAMEPCACGLETPRLRSRVPVRVV
jgi:hypothetical protein